jgi:erythromycin esterase-like protein
MMDTMAMLLKHYGKESKTIIWEHNTHIGDYKATDMVQNHQVSLGGLAREIYGEKNVALVGFTTDHGRVTAASAWDGPTKTFNIPNAKNGSLESVLHQAVEKVGHSNFYLMFQNEPEFSPFKISLGHRAIGVVYHPASEDRGHYIPTILAERYDALIFIDETNSLVPLDNPIDFRKIPETYPYGARI